MENGTLEIIVQLLWMVAVVADSLTSIQIDSLESTRILTEQSLTNSGATCFDLGNVNYSCRKCRLDGDKD